MFIFPNKDWVKWGRGGGGRTSLGEFLALSLKVGLHLGNGHYLPELGGIGSQCQNWCSLDESHGPGYSGAILGSCFLALPHMSILLLGQFRALRGGLRLRRRPRAKTQHSLQKTEQHHLAPGWESLAGAFEWFGKFKFRKSSVQKKEKVWKRERWFWWWRKRWTKQKKR